MSDRETFFPNDIPILIFETRRPDPLRFEDPDGVPAEPTDVEVRFFNGTNGALTMINGSEVVYLDPLEPLLRLEPMNAEEDRGALLYVTIPQEVTGTSGNYTLYITTIYGDGLRITQDQRLQIMEYR